MKAPNVPVITISKPVHVQGGWVLDAKVHYGGTYDTVRITVTERLAALLSKMRANVQISGDYDPEIAGIFDKIVMTGKAILANPLVRTAVSKVPYGSTALTVADSGFALADAVRASPMTARVARSLGARAQQGIALHQAALALARDVRANKPGAVEAVKALPPASKALVEKARFYEARTDAIRDFQEGKKGDAEALERIRRVKALGQRNPFSAAYMEAIENVAIADQAPRDLLASSGDLKDAEVGAAVKRRARAPRPPVVVIAELHDLLRTHRPQAAA